MKTSSFAGKVAAVTGAGSGIGRALALALARRDCWVAASDIDEAGLEATGAAIGAGRCALRRVDVTDSRAMVAWAGDIVRDRGQANLIFNNAGIAYGATIADGSDDDFRRVMDVNFWGVVNGTRAFLPHLAASGDGHVVNISSVAGLLALPGHGAYNAAKFAVRGYTECLRIECEVLGMPVSATCVHPGGIKTNIARAAKVDPSVARFGVDALTAGTDYARQFRTSADRAAEIILDGVQRDARRVLVGPDAHLVDLLQRVFPGHYHGIVTRAFRRMVGASARSRA